MRIGKFELPFKPQQVLIFGALAVLVLLLMDLNNRLTILHEQNQQLTRIIGEVGGMQATDFALSTAVSAAGSEAGVEGVIREDLSHVRPGDIAIIPVPGAEGTPTPSVPVLPAPTRAPNWMIWRVLIFGK